MCIQGTSLITGDLHLCSFFSFLLHAEEGALHKAPSSWLFTDPSPPRAAHAPQSHGELPCTEQPLQYPPPGSSQSRRNKRVCSGCAYSALFSL